MHSQLLVLVLLVELLLSSFPCNCSVSSSTASRAQPWSWRVLVLSQESGKRGTFELPFKPKTFLLRLLSGYPTFCDKFYGNFPPPNLKQGIANNFEFWFYFRVHSDNQRNFDAQKLWMNLKGKCLRTQAAYSAAAGAAAATRGSPA